MDKRKCVTNWKSEYLENLCIEEWQSGNHVDKEMKNEKEERIRF